MHIVTKKMALQNKKDKTPKVWRSLSSSLELPEGVSASYVDFELSVKGPLGEVKKILKYPRVTVEVKENQVVLSTEKLSQREKKIIFTYYAHVQNMIRGVTEGFTYKLSVVYAKFPITIDYSGNKFTVKNLLGEKVPRTFQVPADVKVEVSGGKDITVSGIDKERVGQVAASLEQLTRITHLDRRVIQDGIYIIEKPHKRQG